MNPHQHTFALVSYFPLTKSSATFMNFQMKNQGKKVEKRKKICKLNIKDQFSMFFTVIFTTMTI